MLAYITKKEYVFHSVKINFLIASSIILVEKFFGSHGDTLVKKYHLRASAPCLFRISHGSTTLPLDLLIF